VIQFARYLPLLAQRNAAVTYFVDARLARLLKCLPDVRLATALNPSETFDFQSALLSLPHFLGIDAESVPNNVPYLNAELQLVEKWRERIGAQGFKIGIAWQGSPQGKVDRGRSIPLAEFVPLARLPGVRLISLQKRHGLDQLANWPPDARIE